MTTELLTNIKHNDLVSYLKDNNYNYQVLSNIVETYLFNERNNNVARPKQYGLYLQENHSKRKGTYYSLSEFETSETVKTLLNERQLINVFNHNENNQLSLTIALIERVVTMNNPIVKSLF